MTRRSAGASRPDLPASLAVLPGALFRRPGRKVHGAGWQYDGTKSASPDKLSFGTCFVTCGIVVRLPFCTRPACLPALARLVLPGKTTIPARARIRKKAAPAPGTRLPAAAGLVTLPAAFPGRTVHVVADAACHGPALKHLPPAVTWDRPAARQRGPVRPGPAPDPRHHRPSPPQGRPARHPRPAGRRRPLNPGHHPDLRPRPAHEPGRHHLPVVRLPGHPHRAGHPRPRPRRRPARPGHHRPGRRAPPPWSPATPPAGPSSRPSPAPATSPAPAKHATAPPAPSSAPSRSPCSPAPWSSPGTPATATARPASPPAATPSPGTTPRPNPPSRTCSPSSAAPLSRPEFPRARAPTPPPSKPKPSWQHGTQPPHNCETPDRKVRPLVTPDHQPQQLKSKPAA